MATNPTEDDFIEAGSGGSDDSGAPPAYVPSTKKNKVVTKEQLEKSGMSLRDYLNRERGLTRRRGSKDPTAGEAKDKVAQAIADSIDPGEPGQDRILMGMKKKPSENRMMGSLKLAKGGSVSSASRRADGIAVKGKTRGKMC